jgi:hypothetical protein
MQREHISTHRDTNWCCMTTPQELISRDFFSSNTFAFGRLDGTVICDKLELAEGGRVAGHFHPNEASWRIADQNIEFLDANGTPTTIFDRAEIKDGAYFLYGRFGRDYWHLLTTIPQKAEPPGSTSRPALETLSASREKRGANILAVFLIHHIAAWDALSGIYEAMEKSYDFSPIVISIPHRFGQNTFHGETEVHNALKKEGVRHIRFDLNDHGDGLRILKALAPDMVFRQAPWDRDIPGAYSVRELSFMRLVYTDYGLGIIKGWVDYDQEFHRKAWMLLCANDDQKQLYIRDAQHNGKRAFVTGYPKFDKLIQRGQEATLWPVKGDRRRFRLIWAPHHSVTREWLGFGTFHLVYKDLLRWAASDPDIEIVLKPHPLLLETCAKGLLSETEFNGFLDAWWALGNAGFQIGGDYAPLMSASDAMLTDGISFLTEYPVFGKPMIWLDSRQHAELNILGKRSVEAAYRVSSLGEAMALVQQLQSGGPDPLQAKRAEIRDYLMPFPGLSCDKVLETIRDGLKSVIAHLDGRLA